MSSVLGKECVTGMAKLLGEHCRQMMVANRTDYDVYFIQFLVFHNIALHMTQMKYPHTVHSTALQTMYNLLS